MSWEARQGARQTAHLPNWPRKMMIGISANKIEGVNRSRGEAGETIHHLFMAKLKGYITEKVYVEFRGRYKECIRMLNGLEKTLERKIPDRERRWQETEGSAVYGSNDEPRPQGWPIDVG